MKKLMVLGGSRYALPVIERAHKLGYYVITCDYLPDNIAHKYSDEYINVSIVEQDAVLDAAKNARIDGIMSFACDPGVTTAAYVAEKLNLPSVGSYESVEILQNKALFREFLTKNGFNVPLAKGYSEYRETVNDIAEFKLPIIVKPVDSAGSKGVTRVDSIDELKSAVEKAISFSKTKRFIIEEFIQQVGCSSDSDCFSMNGKLVFASFNNQYFDKNAENPYTPAAFNWPSSMPVIVQNELRNELQRLISLLDLKTSLYNIETRLGTDGKAYIMEVSPRGGGNRLSEMLHMCSGVDLIENAVKAAVGEPIEMINSDPQYNGFWAEIILHSDKDGKFVKLDIDESIQHFVVEEDLWVKPGDEVRRFTGANESIGTIVINCDNYERAEQIIKGFSKLFRVITEA